MATELIEYQEAVDAWVTQFERMFDIADSFYGSLMYSEAEALANLLAVAGRYELARELMAGWAQNDPEMAATYADDLTAWNARNDAQEKEQQK